jgi:hypothetical protein
MDATGRGLQFMEFGEHARGGRVLVVTPTGVGVVLSSSSNGPEGILRCRLGHDAGAWWIEVRKELSVKVEDLEALLHMDWRVVGWRAVLDSSAGTIAKIDGASLTKELPLPRALLAAVRAEGDVDAIRSSVPKDVVEALAFLSAFSSERPDGEETIGRLFREPIEFLLLLFGQEIKPEGTWHFVPGRTWRGLSLEDAELAQFAARFRSVVPGYPLGDFSVTGSAERRSVPPMQGQ